MRSASSITASFIPLLLTAALASLVAGCGRDAGESERTASADARGTAPAAEGVAAAIATVPAGSGVAAALPSAVAASDWTPQLVPVAKRDIAATLARADALLQAAVTDAATAGDNGSGRATADAAPTAVSAAPPTTATTPAPESELQALSLYLSVLQSDAGNAAASAGVDQALTALHARGQRALDIGDLDAAGAVLPVLRRVRPDAPQTLEYAGKLQVAVEVAGLLQQAGRLAAAGKLVTPASGNATQQYRQVLLAQPDNAAAAAGLAGIETLLLGRAVGAAHEGRYQEADRLLAQASGVRPGSQAVQNVGSRIVEIRQHHADALLAQAFAEVDAGRPEPAQQLLDRLHTVSPSAQRLAELAERIEIARDYGRFRPGQNFSDPLASGGDGPPMRVVPAGAFAMGSGSDSDEHDDSERPRHQVRFARGFALARGEISVAQFARFIAATGYRTDAERDGNSTVYDERKGRLVTRARIDWRHDHLGKRAADELPVIHVSWNDAVAYSQWLTAETGHSYRLPSEAEAEYTIRAGSDGVYPWGDDAPPQVLGNLTGDGDRSRSKRSWANAFADYADGYWGPAPVHHFPANRFGLFDTVGNVSEWTLDCWHDGYRRAPEDGSAWINPGCAARVIRGASWASAPAQARSAFRLSAAPDTRNPRVGFRVVREI